MSNHKFLLLVGSTRDGRKTIHAANYLESELRKRGHDVEVFDLEEKKIPFLNNRTYTDGEAPDNALLLSDKVNDSDCLTIISPEYNHSIPGVLKNALDHLYPEYDDKKFSYITTSAGGFGGVRSLSHLHDITLAVGGIPGPNMPISNIGKVFNDEGELIDEDYKSKFNDYIKDVEKHIEK